MGRKNITTEEFIRRGKEVHGETFDYSKTIYTRRDQKLIVTCKIHGDMLIWPVTHLNGSGCDKCYADNRRLGRENFIRKSKLLFNNKFKYDKVTYVNMHQKVILICSNHGEFKMIARKHLQSPEGCPKCCIEKRRSTTEDFIKKAIKVHGKNYDYSLSKYTRVQDEIIIICNNCKKCFKTSPNRHLMGSGCPNCTKTGFNTLSEVSYLYLITVRGNDAFVGFGISSNVLKRLRTHKRNLKIGNCYTEGSITLFKTTGQIVTELEKFIKSLINSKQTNISGFKTESIKSLTRLEIFELCVKWLDDKNINYEILKLTFAN